MRCEDTHTRLIAEESYSCTFSYSSMALCRRAFLRAVVLLVLSSTGEGSALIGALRKRLRRSKGSVPCVTPESRLCFAGIPASVDEEKAVALVKKNLIEDGGAQHLPWIDRVDDFDVLRYVRAAGSVDGATARMLATAVWRTEQRLDDLIANETHLWQLDCFFRRLKPEGSLPEAEWLDGFDARGRPIAIFYADRHTPDEISRDDWRKMVLFNAELAIRDRGVARGPGGQFSLVVDRTKSGAENQDPGLALALLPELLDHYPSLLGAVYVAPVNRLFYLAWNVVKLFLAKGTRRKFVLLGGDGWREALEECVGSDAGLPSHMLPEAGMSSPPPAPPTPPPPLGRSRPVRMQLECTQANVEASLRRFAAEAESMFGQHDAARAVGITGEIHLHSLDGPTVFVELRGRFWHRRETVVANARAFLMRAIPELCDVDVFDEENLLDTLFDEETGALLEDRRSPDWNGDREALAYQGIDPDSRGPFPRGDGAFRPGGSIFS